MTARAAKQSIYIISILIFLLGYGFDISPLQKNRKEIREEIISLEKIILDKRKRLFVKDKEVKNNSISESHLDGVNILDFLTDRMLASNVKPTLFKPDKSKEVDGFVVHPIKLEVEGRYKGTLLFTMFTNNVLTIPRHCEPRMLKSERSNPLDIVIASSQCERSNPEGLFYFPVIESLSLEKKENRIKARLLLLFYESKNIKDASLREVEVLSPNILGRNVFAKLDKKPGLNSWSSKELKFLGLFYQDKKVFGTVEDPLGYLYLVKVGDKIGLDQNKINAIDEEKITIDLEREMFRIDNIGI